MDGWMDGQTDGWMQCLVVVSSRPLRFFFLLALRSRGNPSYV